MKSSYKSYKFQSKICLAKVKVWMFNLRVINSITWYLLKVLTYNAIDYPKAGNGISFGKILFDT